MKKPLPAAHEAAEILAVQALTFIAEDHERMSGFLAATGLEPDQIRVAAQEQGFFAGVLEHVLADESLLVAFADSAVSIRPRLRAPAPRSAAARNGSETCRERLLPRLPCGRVRASDALRGVRLAAHRAP
jgi:hypothetical protein